jgi:5,10-methylene-tetrahydrofolate dehydrogenase/methenyl tetrahydrofolate cyclohydrolase
VIVDVGINVITSVTEKLVEEIPARKLVGDVDFEAVEKEVAWISPVPGGVGPTTVAALFENVLVAALGQ